MMAALSEFERALISERTRAGMAEKKNKGNHLGRPRLLSPDEARRIVTTIMHSNISRNDAARQFGMSRSTLDRYIKEFHRPD